MVWSEGDGGASFLQQSSFWPWECPFIKRWGTIQKTSIKIGRALRIVPPAPEEPRKNIATKGKRHKSIMGKRKPSLLFSLLMSDWRDSS